MLAHDRFDGIGRFIGVVERDAANVVMQDVRLDDAVQQVAADEAHLTIDGGSGASDEIPLVGGVVGERGIGVLQESDGNCIRVSECGRGTKRMTYQASD